MSKEPQHQHWAESSRQAAHLSPAEELAVHPTPLTPHLPYTELAPASAAEHSLE